MPLNNKRIENSEYLLDKIRGLSWIQIPVLTDNVRHTYFWCPVMVRPESGKTIDELKNHLKNNHIGFRQRYSEPLYRQPVLSRLGMDYSRESLSNVEEFAGKVIGLPNHPGLSQENLDRIIDVLNTF